MQAKKTKAKSKTATAVLISDVHFNLKNLPEATASLRAAFKAAGVFNCPLIIAGDLNDTKAIIRGEVLSAIIDLFAEFKDVKTYVLVGNHDLLNEKGEGHSLRFLEPFAEVITTTQRIPELGLYMVPYHADSETLLQNLAGILDGSTVIMHQGFRGAHMGEYVIDRTSIDVKEVERLRVITGHYHRRQTVGSVTYLGTPYTVSFHEAEDGPKGINILWSDGELEHVPLNLRAHKIITAEWDALDEIEPVSQDTILWLKIHGPASELARINKKKLGEKIIGHSNFKLDKIVEKSTIEEKSLSKKSKAEMFDDIIKRGEETTERKKFLSQLWREVMGEDL